MSVVGGRRVFFFSVKKKRVFFRIMDKSNLG